MESYTDTLQFIVIIVLFLLFLLAIKFISSIIKTKRIEDFSITTNNDAVTIEYSIAKIVHSISKVLKKLNIFNEFDKNYQKYVNSSNNIIKEGMDVLTIKILVAIGILIFYIISSLLYKFEITILTIVIVFIIGLLIPSFYYYIKFNKNKTIIVDDILETIIIMNNSLKANLSLNDSIKEVINRTNGIINEEYIHIENDLKLGLSLSEAYKNMYKRTRIKILLNISNTIALVEKSGLNIILAYESIEEKLLAEEKTKIELKTLSKLNKIVYYILLVLPIVIFFSVMLFDKIYSKVIISNVGFIYIFTFVFIYLIYLLIMRTLAKEIYYER